MADPKARADALVEQGLAMYKAGQLDEALVKWEAALELVPDHKQALEYFGYVESNREALEENFLLAQERTGETMQLYGSADNRSSLDPRPVAGATQKRAHLGEDDATPMVAVPNEEATSRMARDQLESALDESRGDLQFGSEEASRGLAIQEDTPAVGDLPLDLLAEASGSFPAQDVLGGMDGAMASKKREEEAGSTSGELILLSDDDYASEVDLAEDGPEFTWTEEPSLGDDPLDSSPGLRIDLTSSEVEISVPDLSDLDDSDDSSRGLDDDDMSLGLDDDDSSRGLDDDDPSFHRGVSAREVLLAGEDELPGSSPDIPELPDFPISSATPVGQRTDSSEDVSWVKEELNRVGSRGPRPTGPPAAVDAAEESGFELSIDSLEILGEDIPTGETLLQAIDDLMDQGKLDDALSMCEQHLADTPGDIAALAKQKDVKELLLGIYLERIGDLYSVPTVLVPRHEIVWQDLDNRTGFLLSRIDGFLSYQDIIDVSTMPTFEACRIIIELLKDEIIGIS